MEKLYQVETNYGSFKVFADSSKRANFRANQELDLDEKLVSVRLDKTYNKNAKTKTKMAKMTLRKPKTSYSKKANFSVRAKTKNGNVMVTQGWSKKAESKIVKTIGYKTKSSKYGKAAKKKLVITTIKKTSGRKTRK